MPDVLNCPACGERVADDLGVAKRASRCEKCGTVLSPMSDDWNPYNAPSSPLGIGDDGDPKVLEVPASDIGKFGLAIRLLASNLVLFSLIILTVWLPGNVASQYFLSDLPEADQVMASIRLNNILQGVFGHISIGALVFAVAKRMNGENVGYFEAIGVGFRNWGRLFAANFVAGLIIGLACLALIVPGIIMAVRYSLINPVVVLEHSNAPRERSTALTKGRRWRIAGAGILFFVVFFPASFTVGFAVGYAQEQVDWLNNVVVSVATDCLLDIGLSVLTIVMVLFYMEARGQELKEASNSDEGDLFSHLRNMEPL